LKVFDVLGNEITTLVNEEQEAGNYKVSFSAEGGSTSDGGASKYNLSSGIYFYRLQAGKFMDTKKFVFVK
jgi:hypothetical protein